MYHPFVDLISKVIISIITIVDPKYLILCGFRFTSALVDQIRERLASVLPAKLLPELVLQPDISDEYLTGIITVICNLITEKEPYAVE